MLAFSMIAMAGTAFRKFPSTEPRWVVSLLDYVRGKALDKVMGGVHCRSLPLSFGHSLIRPLCRSRYSTQNVEHVLQ